MTGTPKQPATPATLIDSISLAPPEARAPNLSERTTQAAQRSAPLPPRQPGRSRRALAGAVVGLLLVAATVVGAVLLQNNGSGGDTETPTTSVSNRPETGGASPATTEAGLRAGDACSWQLEGDRRGTEDGELICAVDGGVYRWVVASG